LSCGAVLDHLLVAMALRSRPGDGVPPTALVSTSEAGHLDVAVLLKGTLAGLATCTLTQMTEVRPSRDIIWQVTGQIGSPQLLIRFGVAPSSRERLPVTP